MGFGKLGTCNESKQRVWRLILWFTLRFHVTPSRTIAKDTFSASASGLGCNPRLQQHIKSRFNSSTNQKERSHLRLSLRAYSHVRRWAYCTRSTASLGITPNRSKSLGVTWNHSKSLRLVNSFITSGVGWKDWDRIPNAGFSSALWSARGLNVSLVQFQK